MKKNILAITTIGMLLLSSFAIAPVFGDTNEPSNETIHYVGGEENKQQPELTLTNEYTPSKAIMKAGGEGTSQRGDIVWDNGMHFWGLFAAQNDTVLPLDAYPADDFHFDKDTEVNDVHWIGGYWNGDPATFDWEITFYLDNVTDSKPDDIYAGPYVYVWDDINTIELDIGLYEMSVRLPEDILFIGCETYWISIIGIGDVPPQSGWGYHNDTILMHEAVFKSVYFGFPDWTNSSDVLVLAVDMCFQLTFTEPCSIDVEKYVWDPVLGDWVDADDAGSAVDLPVDSTAKFMIAIHNDGMCDLLDVWAYDFMEDSLEFVDADPYPTTIVTVPGGTWLNWTGLGDLSHCEWIYITVNATVVGPACETDENNASADAWCPCEEMWVYDEDSAFVHAIPHNNPPYKPSEPNPENGKPDANLTPILSVLVIDPDGNTMNVSFYGKEVGDTDHDTYKYIGTDTGVPSGGRAQITWPGLDYDTTCKWYAIADDGKESNTSDRWSFTTRAQYIPDPPTDFIATTINRTCINLSWTNAGDNKTYIEWNTSETWNRGEGTPLYNGTDTSYSHTNLNFNTQYFYQAWSYNETDNIYSLTYASDNATTDANQPPYMPSDPNPENGITDVDKNADLSWTGGDPDDDTVTYDVYFGNTGSPPKVENNQSTTTYEPGTLEFNTTYYWKIVAWDNYNESNASSIWSFTTEKPPNKPPKVEIIKPERAVYINNQKILPRLIRMTLIIGDITIEVNATDEDSGIEKVEFIIKSIDGEVKNTSYERNEDGLYSYTWTRDRIRLIHIHIIKVVAYDKDGATAKQQMIVRRYL